RHARVRRERLLQARDDGAGARRAGDGGGDVQGVRAPGRQHAGGDAVDAGDPMDRALPLERPGGALPPPPQGGRRLARRVRRGDAMSMLPVEFADLEPFAATWCLEREPERYGRRMTSTVDEMQAFYDAVVPRADAAMTYLEQFPLDSLPED